jgi:hypothetical protein
MKRIKILEADAILSNQKIANVEKLLRVSRESNYKRLRHLKHVATFAKISAAWKAAECASRIRAKASTKLQVARNMFHDDAYRLQQEHNHACQQAVLDESRHLEGLTAKHGATFKRNTLRS